MKKPDSKPTPSLRSYYDGLPDTAKDNVMRLLADALHQRGYVGHCTSNADGFIRQIADVFGANGAEIEEYT